jgi:hypothetical protein
MIKTPETLITAVTLAVFARIFWFICTECFDQYSFVLDDWMWRFLKVHSAVLAEDRGSKGDVRGPFVGSGEMANDVLVENALS